MTPPTHDEIAALESRGWTFDPEYTEFAACGMADRQGNPILVCRLRQMGRGGWVASYGVTGCDYSPYTHRPDPLAAADDAEAWLRSVLAPFRFGWLRVTVPS